MFLFDSEILEFKDYLDGMRLKVQLGINVYSDRIRNNKILITEISSQGFKIKRFGIKTWITWDEYDGIRANNKI